jgi:hypothetical protein
VQNLSLHNLCRLKSFGSLMKCIFFCFLPSAMKMRSYQSWVLTGAILLSNIAVFLVSGHVDRYPTSSRSSSYPYFSLRCGASC